MPYSELHRMAKGQRESSTQTKMNNFSNDLAFVPDNEFVELLWENGQIVMQGQTSKTRKGSLCTGFSSQTPKAQQNDGEDAVLPVPAKSGRYVHLDSVMHDFPSSGQEGNVGLVQDDEMVPWLNYPLDDSFERDYYSDFFPELSGVNLSSISGQTNAVPVDKSNSFGQTVRSSSHTVSAHSGSNVEQGNDSSKFVRLESEPISNLHPSFKVRTSQLSSSQCQSSLPTSRSGVSEFVSNNPQVFSENSSQTPVLATGSFPAKLHQQDPPSTRPSLASNIGAVNFSHFARPAALVRANLQNIGVPTGLSSGDKLRSNAKMSVTSSNPVESSLVESTSLSKSVPGCHDQALSTLPKVDLQLSNEPSQEPLSVDYSEAICQEDPSGSKSRDQVLCPSSSFAASTAFGRSDSGKAFEPVVTSSSVCSGNSAGKASKDHKHGAKRKCREVEESGYQSEDVEEESVDLKKPSTGRSTNAKRSRAAEVHNLSERRRRDRINEKMRALQELIPNCNKVDKASMLDEAIEYLKTLQMQVQIMSMGSGLCMPPMMLPAGMQHMHTPHMARFSPMGVGMGVGFGMGMLDMSCSTSFPLIPVPSMHGAQIPCPSISGATSLPGIPGSSIQMFGIPGQGLSMSMPRGPFVPLSGFPARTGSAPDMSAAPNTALLPDSAPSCSSKGHVHNINLRRMHKTSGHRSEIQEAPKVTTESFEQSALAHRNHQTSHANGSEAPSSIS